MTQRNMQLRNLQNQRKSLTSKQSKNQLMQKKSNLETGPERAVQTDKLSVLIRKSSEPEKSDRYEMIKKPFQGNENALQWPCGGIKDLDGPLSGAYKANKKSKVFNQPQKMFSVDYKDDHGQKELHIFDAVEVCPAEIDSPYVHVYLTSEEIKSNPDVTALSKFAFEQYLNYQSRSK